jgi:DNA recombination protein RmuC
MSIPFLVLLLVTALSVGAVVAWMARGAKARQQLGTLEIELATFREKASRFAGLECEVRDLRVALESSRVEVLRLSKLESESSRAFELTSAHLQTAVAENDAADARLADISAQLLEVSRLKSALETAVSGIPELRDRLAKSTQGAEAAATEIVALREQVSRLQAELRAEREALTLTRDEQTHLRDVLETSRMQVSSVQLENSDLKTRLEAERHQFEEKSKLLIGARQELSDQFKAIAADILDEKTRKFTEQNQLNLSQLLDPLKTKLVEFHAKVDDVYVKDTKDRTALREQVRQLFELNNALSQDAKNLTQALKGSNRTQGTWGELVLERILESAGLRKGEEYVMQESHHREDGTRAQPDAIVNLPQDRNLVIDSKVSLVAYEELCSGKSDEGRAEALSRHLVSVRAHITALAGKNYQALYQLKSLDCVLMFVPIEPAFTLAVTNDKELFMDAWRQNVLLVSPSTLLFVIRMVAYLWRQEAQNRNALDIAKRGGELYDRLCAFVADLEKVGERLAQAQQTYQDAHSKLTRNRGNVIRQAEMLRDLGVKPSKTLPPHLVDKSDDATADTICASRDPALIDTSVQPLGFESQIVLKSPDLREAAAAN